MGRKKKMRGPEGLTPSRVERRVYPDVGKVDCAFDITEIRRAIEEDATLSREEKRRRLQYMYAITHSGAFEKQWKGSKADLERSRMQLKRAYQRYMKG